MMMTTTTMIEEETNDDKEAGSEKEQLSFSSPFEMLSSETLGHVVSFCDFPSALLFSRATSSTIRQELYLGDHFLWKEIFRRHCFSLPTLPSPATINVPPIDYLRETRKRRKLAQTLLVPRRSNNGGKTPPPARSCCFNLPNRCFYFVPVTPDGFFWDDPPPVDFGCDSFILTSTACGGEMLSLDPFHGTLSVYESCLDNAVASDEGMMELAMLEAASLIDGNRQHANKYGSLPEEHIAGAVFDQSVYRNHNIAQYKKSPFQILFRLEEDIDLDACFPTDRDGNDNVSDDDHDDDDTDMSTSQRQNVRAPRPPEVDVGYHGIDAKCILKDNQVVGTQLAVGRMFTKETSARRSNNQNNSGQRGENELVCTELNSWTRYNEKQLPNTSPRNHLYGGRQICRFPWSFRSIDLCAAHNRVYVTFDHAEGPLSRNIDAGRASNHCASTIVVYPMVPYPSHCESRLNTSQIASQKSGSRFHEPAFLIRCQAEITTLAVDPAGDTLIVGTTKGTCEVWNIVPDSNGATTGKRTAIINIKASISRAFENTNEQMEDEDMTNSGSSDFHSDDSSRMRRKLLTIFNRPKIVSFHHPGHFPLATCGFVTLQHSSSDGSSLILWRKHDDPSSSDAFQIVSLINLPLSGTARAPRVFYDGRRILVFGQDHIGLIILVYHVLASNEDIGLFQETTKEETSGGVYNLTVPSRARFANRIRHAALGGLQYYDSIHMTCNDRFIVVNTKTGNLLSDSASPYAEGLVVIDLQD